MSREIKSKNKVKLDTMGAFFSDESYPVAVPPYQTWNWQQQQQLQQQLQQCQSQMYYQQQQLHQQYLQLQQCQQQHNNNPSTAYYNGAQQSATSRANALDNIIKWVNEYYDLGFANPKPGTVKDRYTEWLQTTQTKMENLVKRSDIATDEKQIYTAILETFGERARTPGDMDKVLTEKMHELRRSQQ